MAPCAHDVFSARLIQQAGFPVVSLGGYSTACTLTAQPDVGLLTMTEVVGQARNMAAATSLPVMADADTGYGSVLNVWRTVREFENAGVASVMLEDQVTPKRCDHIAGTSLIDKEEMVGKIVAALDARQDPEMLIVARTDARGVIGLRNRLRSQV